MLRRSERLNQQTTPFAASLPSQNQFISPRSTLSLETQVTDESRYQLISQLFGPDEEEEEDEAPPQQENVNDGSTEFTSPTDSLQLPPLYNSDDEENDDAPQQRTSSRIPTQRTFFIPNSGGSLDRRPRAAATQVDPANINDNDNNIVQAPVSPTQQDLSTVWVVFTDGSYTPTIPQKQSLCGWGVIIVTNGDEVVTLGGKVAVRKGTYFLQNQGGTKSNNTAELTGIAEGVLYVLAALRRPNPPVLTKIVIRPDSEYAENSVKGQRKTQGWYKK
jgi:ribonuclease HI